ncbi:succinylglutamate desuccinylase/aspartoacylase family protein [Amycolatopsis jejuensis]|uniref:succinylglutamate desuccinylase/aspartoacylase family protein n=1 Tax=Amycolatopsis jejuensis TaxID=330084 RepID=UPI00052480BB|nr:succinylglutamate desuccinylase/aspartoacylase family protein [Amycolatopsis jejuensis]
MDSFELGDLSVKPGTIGKGSLASVRLSAGTQVASPVVVAHGVEPGPVLLAMGATHGDEIVGTAALIATLKALDPTTMRGTLIAITVANPLAFEHASYESPHDRLHMALPVRWPAAPQGLITQRLAASHLPAFEKATHYLDIHGNPDPSWPIAMLLPEQASTERVRKDQELIADATGLTRVRMTEPADASGSLVGSIAGQPAAAASAHGVAGVMLELVSRGSTTAAEMGRIAVMNTMRALGILDDEPEPQVVPRLEGVYQYHGGVVNQHAGIFWSKHLPGSDVDAGTVIAEITDVWGDTVEEVTVPVDGFLWGHLGTLYGNSTHAIPEGSFVGFVAARPEPGA